MTDPAPGQSLAQQDAQKTQTGEQVPEAFNWNVMEPRVRKLISDWDGEVRETKRRRAIRKIDVNTEALRVEGKLLADEILIGVRVADENIRKEQPIFVSYLTQSRRLAIFDCQTNPRLNTEPLEIAFTKGMSYSGFLKNIFKCIDGAQTHGWDSVEVLFDSSKPLHCGVEHIGHENLIFSSDAKDIQAQEFILRGFDVTIVQLKRFKKKHGFNPPAIDSIVEDMQARQADTPRNVRIYKYFTKVEGVVFVGWCSLRDRGEGTEITGWLKDPKPLDMGRRTLQEKTTFQESIEMVPDVMTGLPVATPIKKPVRTQEWVPETEELYPIVPYLYSESEEQCITSQKGRVFFDLPSQEAQIALWSLFINGAVRASNVYASPDQASATGSAMRKLDMTLDHGCIYSEPMRFFHTDYPDPGILRAADGLNTRKSQEMGKSAEAVINRDDSRKTAEELQQAEGEQTKMGTIPIMLFSGFMREVLSLAWYIVHSQAVQNLVMIMPMEIVLPGPAPLPGMPPSPGRSIRVNNPTFIAQTYDIKPAGDTDVIRRAEKIERRMLLLPIIQPTAAYPEFLMDLIREMLPEDADKYNSILQQGIESQQQQMLGMAQMLQEATTDEKGAVMPEWKPFEAQLTQMFNMIPKGQGAGQAGQQQQAPK